MDPRRLIAALILLLLPSLASADPPSADETAAFNAILARIQGRPAAAVPRSVASAIQTFAPGCWTATVACPAGGPLKCVQYTVCTNLVAWSRDAAGDEEGAAYFWDEHPVVTTNDTCKVAVMHNSIMVDLETLAAGETGGALDQVVNEALVYHELLHAQLGIEALDDALILNPVCQCAGPNPGSQSDVGHTRIPELQDSYVKSVGASIGATVQVLRIQTPASGNAFALHVPVDKPNFTIRAVLPNNSNVDSVKIGDRENGKVPLSGTLTDPGKVGSVIILIDPPAFWEVIYLDAVPGPTPAHRRSWGEIKQIYR